MLASENAQNSLLILPDVLVILILGLYDFLRAGPEKDTEKKSCYVLEMCGEAQRTAAGGEKPVTGFRYVCNNCKNQKKGKDHKFQASLGSIAKPYIKQ